MATVIKENGSVTFMDLGDQIAAIVFKNDMISSAAAAEAAEALKNAEGTYSGIVVTGAGNSLCSGIDLTDIRETAAEKDWAKLESISDTFQALTQAVKFSKIPVVVLAKGNVMDYGLELATACSQTVLADSAVMAYNTAKNGFAPMGGGLTQAAIDTYAIGAGVKGVDIVPFLKRTFENLYNGKPATGAEAAAKGYLFKYTKVLATEACTLEKAKQTALLLAAEGYQAPEPAKVIVKGYTGKGALDIAALNTALGFFITESLHKISCHVSNVLTGGDVPNKTEVSEAQLLKLEKEAFVKTLQEA